MLEGKISVYERLFRILSSTNQGFYQASAMVNDKGAAIISYEIPNQSRSVDKETFFEIDCSQKTINFGLSPKGDLTQREVSELVADLKKAGYKVGGEFFLTRKFKPNEISLY